MEGRISKLFRSGLSMLVVLCMVVAMCPAVFAAGDNNTETDDTSALVSLGYDLLGYLPEEVQAAFDKLVEMVKAKDPAAAEELVQYAKDHGVFEAVKKALAKIDAESVAKAEDTVKKIIANADEIVAALKNEVLTLDENLKTLKTKLEEAQNDLGKLQDDLDAAKAEYAEAEKALNDKKAELAPYGDQLTDAQKQELADAEKKLADAKVQLDDAQAKIDEAGALLDEAIAKLDEAIALVEDNMSRIEAAVVKMEGYIASLKVAVETMKTEGFLEGVRDGQTIVNDMLADAEELVGQVSEDTAVKLSAAIDEVKTKLDELYAEANDRYHNVIAGEYHITADSYYVALGDASAAGESYVDALAAKLGVEFKNLSASDLTVEGAFDLLDEVTGADLVTIGFGNEGFTRFATLQMTKMMMGQAVSFDWTVFGVKEEVLTAVEEAKTKLHDELVAAGVTQEFQGMEMAQLLVTGVEAYAYSYANYVYNLPKLVDEIQAINPDTTIVVVGTYNVLEGVTLVMDEHKLNMDRFMGYVAEVTDLSTLALAMLDENVVFVDAPAVDTVNTEVELKANEIIGASQYGDLVPNEASHLYIAEQIWNALTITKDEDTTCEHEMGAWRYLSYPDCTNPGMMIRNCTKCDYFETRHVAALGHAFGDWTVTKEATCTEPGEETSTCYVCGAVETREIEATGHTFGEWTVTKEATCTEKGEETRTCDVCGEVETREIETIGHTFGEWTETKAANCTDAGEKTRTCYVCGEVETAAIAAKGHKYGTWGISKGASCTEPGEGIRTCSVCGASETCVLEPTGIHAYSAWTVTTEPTCTVAGVETRTCSCGEAETREIPATGVHTFGDWTVTKEPTTEAEGEETRTCSQCGLKETRPVDKIPAEPVAEKNNLWWILLIIAGVGGAGTGGYFYLKKKQIF